jgi:hypothetical protein
VFRPLVARTRRSRATKTARRVVYTATWPIARLRRQEAPPPRGFARFGSFRRTEPISRRFGFDRGTGIDRYYIEAFLRSQASDFRGRVVEIGDDHYVRSVSGWTPKAGHPLIDSVDILHVTGENPKTTIVADVANAPELDDAHFDCVVCPQTLQFIYDVRAAVATIHRILRPGGVLLATANGISQLSRYDVDRWGEYWRFTQQSLKRVLGEHFGEPNVEVRAHGNVLVGMGLLYGLAAEELRRAELDATDPDYEVILTARAVKAEP